MKHTISTWDDHCLCLLLFQPWLMSQKPFLKQRLVAYISLQDKRWWARKKDAFHRVSPLVTDTTVFTASLSETEGDARGKVMLSDHACCVQHLQSQTQSTLFPIFVPTFIFPLKHRLRFWSVSDIKPPLINICTEALGWDGQYFPSSVQTQARGFIKVCRGSIYNGRTAIREPRDPSGRTGLDLTLLHFRLNSSPPESRRPSGRQIKHDSPSQSLTVPGQRLLSVFWTVRMCFVRRDGCGTIPSNHRRYSTSDWRYVYIRVWH